MSDIKFTNEFDIGDVLMGTVDNERILLVLVGTETVPRVLFLGSLSVLPDTNWNADMCNLFKKIGNIDGLYGSLLHALKEENIT